MVHVKGAISCIKFKKNENQMLIHKIVAYRKLPYKFEGNGDLYYFSVQ